MIEALAAALCVGRAWTSCAARTAFIGRERAAKVRCRLHHLVRARQSLLHRGSQARAGLSLPSGHSRLSRGNERHRFSRRAAAVRLLCVVHFNPLTEENSHGARHRDPRHHHRRDHRPYRTMMSSRPFRRTAPTPRWHISWASTIQAGWPHRRSPSRPTSCWPRRAQGKPSPRSFSPRTSLEPRFPPPSA